MLVLFLSLSVVCTVYLSPTKSFPTIPTSSYLLSVFGTLMGRLMGSDCGAGIAALANIVSDLPKLTMLILMFVFGDSEHFGTK